MGRSLADGRVAIAFSPDDTHTGRRTVPLQAMSLALRILKGANVQQVAEAPPPLYVPIPAPELSATYEGADELVCAKAAETGCASEGMASKHWWHSKKRIQVCCRCKEEYHMSAGYPLEPRDARWRNVALLKCV